LRVARSYEVITKGSMTDGCTFVPVWIMKSFDPRPSKRVSSLKNRRMSVSALRT